MSPCPDCGKETDRSRCRSCTGKLIAYRRKHKLGPTKGSCVDCGKEIGKYSKRCPSCEMVRKWTIPEIREKIIKSSSKSHFRGGLPYCPDCGKRLKSYESKRCPSCAQSQKWKDPAFREKFYANNPYFGEGKDHPKWSGGNSPDAWRHSRKGLMWRRAVYKRDNYVCQMCGKAPKRPDAHHIKSAKDFPKLRFDITNGITLCKACHSKVHIEKIEIVPGLIPFVPKEQFDN